MRDQISRVEKCRTVKYGTGKCRTENAGLENTGPVSLRELNFKKRKNLLCIVV